MIEHIVLFKFREGTSEAKKEECARRLRHLIYELPGIIDIQAGQNYSSRSKGYSMALTVRFKSKEDHEHYTPSPEHQAVLAFMNDALTDTLAVDFEIPEEA